VRNCNFFKSEAQWRLSLDDMEMKGKEETKGERERRDEESGSIQSI
jgi:hypothetical protein